MVAISAVLVIAGYVFLEGGLLYNPGPLNAQSGEMLGGVTSHTQIGGDCKACHTAPWEPAKMEDRCVDCHDELAIQIQSLASLHGKILYDHSELNCRDCHREHRGPDAHLTEMTVAAFPHEMVGYSLNGHQLTVTRDAFICSDCHGDDLSRFDLKRCDSCHRQMDPGFVTAHTLSFGSACLDCHDGTDKFVENIDHNNFSFKLHGKHADVNCKQCHVDNVYIGLPMDCYSCHRPEDEHKGQFGMDCAACHNPTNWDDADFDHNLSNFPLRGRHIDLVCERCHSTGQFTGLSSACVSCHGDPVFHAGMFGFDCATCHTTENWFAQYRGSHPMVADEGGRGVNHGGASCRDCHTQTLQTATCTACHDGNNPEGEGGDEDDD